MQEETVSQSPKEPEPEPTAPPEPAKPKSIYDYEFDVEAIRQELLGIGTGMGLTIDSSLTPDTASWGNPVTASKDFQGTSLERSLKDYVRSMPGLITAYGGSQFNTSQSMRKISAAAVTASTSSTDCETHTTLCFNRQRVFFCPKI